MKQYAPRFVLVMATVAFTLSSFNLTAVRSSAAKSNRRTATVRNRIKADNNPIVPQPIGLIYDKDARAGEWSTFSLKTDAKQYETIPGLGVIELQLTTARDSTPSAALENFVVDAGDGTLQRADQPFTVQLAANATRAPITLRKLNGSSVQLDPSSVSVALKEPSVSGRATPPATAAPGSFTTPPVVLNTSFIRGPLRGDSRLTQIMVDDKPVSVIAESQQTVYFDLPGDTQPGSHQLTIRDGQNTAMFPIVKMSLTGHIDQPSLVRGQKTNYSVTLNFGPLPAEFWRNGGGSAPELMSPALAQQAAPGFHVPQTGEPGVVLLSISNASRANVSIIPSKDERRFFTLHEQDFQNNQFTTRGEVQSKVSGTFRIDLLAQGFFAPIHGTSVSFSLRTSLCPNLCPSELQPAGGVEVAITPKGYAAGEIDKMASGVNIIRNMPIPGPGKTIRDSAAALIEGAFGFAEAVAKKNGVSVWVRVTCYVCEDESCLLWTRKNWVKHQSAWDKVMDLESLTKSGGATMDENLTMDQIAQAIKDKSDSQKCP